VAAVGRRVISRFRYNRGHEHTMRSVRDSSGVPLGPTPLRAVRLQRLAGTLVLWAVGFIFALLLVVRFVVLPQVELRRADIAAALSQKIGQPVEIDAIATGWDGWNPKLSIRGLRFRNHADRAAEPLLDLPRVDLIVSWTSLPLLDFRLRELIVDEPKLSVRRDAAGRIRIAGIALDPDRRADDAALSDWLLRQRQIVVRNALITWDDELRHAPQLVLDQVQFRLEHSFGHHRFGLTGTPPAELAAPVDLRGDIVGLVPSDLEKVDGRFYLRLDYADVAAWREWLTLPLPVESGKGALRLWTEMAQGQPREVTADLELSDVDTRLAPDLPALELDDLSGRIGWKHDGGRREIFTKALRFRATDGTELMPTDFTFVHDDATATRPAEGKLSFARLELAPLTAVAAHLPLPDGVRRDLARFAPRGTLKDGKYAWQGQADAPLKFTASGAFDRLGVNAQDIFPGANGVSGSFDADEAKGTLKLASQNASLSLPRVFADPIELDSASGGVRWERGGDAWQVTLNDLAFANGHAAGTAAGAWRSLAAGPGAIDLKAHLTRANVEQLYHYLPLHTHPAVREWLKRALQKGTSNDVRIVVNGNLAEFPFAQGKGGQFLMTMKGQGGVLDYAAQWPPLSEVEADLAFDGTRFTLDATSAKILGATISHTHAEIADLRDPNAVLKVNGEAAGPTAEFLAFIAQSPVAEWTGRFTDGAQAIGNGRLALKFDLPLHAAQDTTVTGDYQFIGNQIRVPGVPALSQLNGKLGFTDRSLTGNALTAEVLGGPLKFDVTGSDGRVRVTGAGTANLAQLKGEIDSPLAERFSGTAEWQVVANARPQAATWTIESSLKGAAIDLPAPFGKTAGESVALRIERREPTPARKDELLSIDYGSTGRLLLRRPLATGAPYDHALLLLGTAVERIGDLDRPGLWVRADVQSFNFDDWLAVGRALPSKGRAGATVTFEGADIDAATLQAFGRKFNEMKVSARRAGEDWRVALDGGDAAGTAVWRAPSPTMPNGRIVARLSKLTAPGAGDTPTTTAAKGEPPRPASAANAWPEIDLATDAFYSRGHDVGKLEFTARPAGSDWQIESLTLANDAGDIKAGGWWRTADPQQTKLDVAIDAREAGAFLAHFGTADAITGASTKIEGQLSWAGAPSDFDYPSLNGSFRLTSGAGQFLKADPGVGRLLGVLSLQSLPRRITLDFRDVFSEGFAFDSIAGSARIQDGMMSTDNLRMVGPSAAVDISGTVDLAHETQKIKVRVQPALSSSISAGAAVLFIANPLLGAAVGAGTLLAQKVFKDPIEQLFSYEYAVSGSWSDPVVERISNRTAAAPAQTTTK
jgi:uncharacterized protein (TIGR02099 family)